MTYLAPKVFKLEDFSVTESDLISVMMPFDGKFNKVYDALKDAADELRLRCLRADDIWIHDHIMQDIASLIQRSKIVICDCTGRNPNVFYEAGISHTLGKDVILITQNENDIPFDLRSIRYIKYLDNSEGRKLLAEQIKQRIQNLINGQNA